MTAVPPREQPPSWRRVEVALIDTARRLRTAFDFRLQPLDLNLSQASLLAFVSDFGESTQTALAEMVGLGRAATGTMIAQLEARGFLVRLPDPTDRRVWLVGITAAGREVVDAFYAIDANFQKEIRRDISRDDRQQLAALLERLGANIDSVLASSVGANGTDPKSAGNAPAQC